MVICCLPYYFVSILIEEIVDLSEETTVKYDAEKLSDEKIYSDQTISKLVRDVTDWKKTLKGIIANHNSLQEATVEHSLSDELMDTLEEQMEQARNSITKLIEAVEKEDLDRNLRTLDSTRPEQRKFKTFSGTLGEDFLYFKKDFEETVIANRISRSNQLEKLRECLTGEALKHIPKNMTGGLTAAWTALQVMFGDPSRLFKFRLKALTDMGMFPPSMKGSQPNYAAQAAWLAPFLVELDEIIALGLNHSELHNTVFNSTVIDLIVSKFTEPLDLQMLDLIVGDDKEKLVAIKSKLETCKARIIRYTTKVVLNPEAASKVIPPKKSSNVAEIKGMTVFKNPQRFDECRICDLLVHSHNAPDNLYENHLSDWVTGCPIFMSMKTSLRLSKARQAEFCLRCFDRNVKYIKGGSHVDKTTNQPVVCTVTKQTKHRYSCMEENCLNHMWVCRNHQSVNRATLKKQQDKLKKQNITFSFLSLPPSQQNVSANSEVVPKSVLQNKLTLKNRNVKKKKLMRTPDFIPVPKGAALFMFQQVEGKTRAVNWFYDSGCSTIIMKPDIPVKEYDSKLIQKGPFNIGGVGGATIMADAEYLISVKRDDGRLQHFQGLTLNNITSKFPSINVEKAVQDVKASDPKNQMLQECSVPKMVGGDVDVLVGITYMSSFPKLVHMLDCGLGIYKVKLKSHDPRWNALIGGAHETFNVLSEKAGNAGILLANFVDSLKRFRTAGPPKLSSLPWTIEEELFAKSQNLCESDVSEVRQVIKMESVEHAIIESTELEKNRVEIVEEKPTVLSATTCVQCHHVDFESEAVCDGYQADLDNAWELRGFLKQAESGLDVEYRCIRCRNCLDCKNSDVTDKISLREEQELQQCRDSVQLDFENKRINVSLPLRAAERDFLTSNKEIAEQILLQQCKKYSNDPETKELLIKAFKKLFEPGHLVLLEDLSEEVKMQFLSKEVQYFIPWRVQFKDSVSTPARPVFDGSTKTKKRPDQSGGRCLNDLVCKGVIKSINMIKLLLRFIVGLFALAADIKQFYNTSKLITSQWNLQRFVYKEDLDLENETKEGVITTSIYGVKCASCQGECVKEKLADHFEEEKPSASKTLVDSTYVDDIGDSKGKKDEAVQLQQDVDEVLGSVGMSVKDWTYSGSDPSSKVSNDGVSLDIGGMKWFSKADLIEVKIPYLHFGKYIRGRIKPGTEFFEGGTMADLDKFLPNRLSKRMVASKTAGIYDPLGKLAPALALAKLLLRLTNNSTVGWDDPMPAPVRKRWVDVFWRLEMLRGLKFSRPVMPSNAVDTKLRILVGGDTAGEVEMIGAWGGFRLTDGSFSCQHLLGRSLLTDANKSIAKLELDSLCGASNMKWIIRMALNDWVDTEILFNDSRIALFWTISENKRLGIFHRSRVLQIRRGTNLDHLYYVKSSHNPCDIGTRPDKLNAESVGPNSIWQNGHDWMSRDLSEAIAKETIVPALQLKMKPEEEESFNEGCIYERPEILTRGHVSSELRITKIEERAASSNYPLLPTKFSLPTVVIIYGCVMRFASNCLKSRRILSHLRAEARLQFSAFPIITNMQPSLFHKTGVRRVVYCPSDEFISMALTFLYQKGAQEVKAFNSASTVKKHTIEKNGILYSQGRLIDGMTFLETGGLTIDDLGPLGINIQVPVLDRFSPLSYSIANYVHWEKAKHKGVETCCRMSLEKVHILQAGSIYKELADECIRCRMKRKRFMKVIMGPVSPNQLTIAPPMWAAQLDLFGPIPTYVPGYERETRGRKALSAEVYVMVFVCPSTRLVNLQVIEGKNAGCILDGVTRMSCEIGVPKYLMIDDDAAIKNSLRELEVDVRDLTYKLHREKGIIFDICPVSGHSKHGLVERTIRTIQSSMEDAGFKNQRLHSTGVQTLLKLVENTYNNAPIGYRYGRDADNGPILKTISPNMIRLGRNNERALDGNFRLPNGGTEMIQKVDRMYQTWYSLWRDSIVPKLIHRPKWFKTDTHLKVGDLVYYEKDSGKATSPWVVGIVDQVVRGADGHIREVVISYRNYKENFNRTTTRAVRSLVKIFSIDDLSIQEDLAEVQRRIDGIKVPAIDENDVVENAAEFVSDQAKCKTCCCLQHCKISSHGKSWKNAQVLTSWKKFTPWMSLDDNFQESRSYYEDFNETEESENQIFDAEGSRDSITQLLKSVDVNLNLI